jgi:CubicO group peptidase (beta-lactamase class C family)
MPGPHALLRRLLAVTGMIFLASLIAAGEEPLDRVVIRGKTGKQLDEYLSRAVPFGFSGTVLIADADGILLHKGYGMADVRRRRPNGINTIFDMGSITKALTATAILGLESEGKLHVDDRLSKYFDVPADKQEITLHQLLTHTSGLVSDVGGDYDDIPKAVALQRMFAAPLVSSPGASFNYSNAGFSLLAAILEKVTGEEYEKYMRRKFFLPAGMQTTGYREVKWKPQKVAHNYQASLDLDTPLTRLVRANGPNWNLLGNGGVLTTAADIYRWELAYRANKLIPPEAQAKQFTPQFRRSPTLANGYDWWLEDTEGDSATAFHRGGDSPAYALNAEYRRYPAEKVTIILLANNRLNGWSSRRYTVPAIRKIMLGKEQVLPPAVRSAKVLPLEAKDGPDVQFLIEPAPGHLKLLATGQTAVDALTFFRSPASLATRRRLNTRAQEFIAALQRGQKEEVASFVAADQLDGVVTDWQREVALRKGLSRVEVLGTARLDRGQFLTTLRLHFAGGKSPVTVRFVWASNMVQASSDDFTLPVFTPVMRQSPVDAAAAVMFWPTGTPGEFVAHDLLTTETLRLTFERGFMLIHVPDAPLKVRVQSKNARHDRAVR